MALNYGLIQNYADRVGVATNDCFDFMNVAAKSFAVLYCSHAFDYVTQAS